MGTEIKQIICLITFWREQCFSTVRATIAKCIALPQPVYLYHSCTCPSPLPDIELFPQYLPVTPPISPKPSRMGIFAPSSTPPTHQSTTTQKPPGNTIQKRTRRLRRRAPHHPPHIRRHPPRTAAINHQPLMLPRQRRRQGVHRRFADGVGLLRPAVLALGAAVGGGLVFVHQGVEIREGHLGVAEAGAEGGGVV